MLFTVMYVLLWGILPNLEGEGRAPGVKDKTTNGYRGKAQDWEKSNTTELGGMGLAACSTQPLSSLCDRGGVALALAAALRLRSLSCKSLEFFLRVTFSAWFSLSFKCVLSNCSF